MKKCPECGVEIIDDKAQFCPSCGKDCSSITIVRSGSQSDKESPKAESLLGDKNLINESTLIGRQDKYEASNITIHNNITEDQSHKLVECAVSGKRVYMDHSVVCPKCGRQVALEYYVEATRRCENCERQTREEYRTFAIRTLGEGALDAARKELLDAEARRLQIDEETQLALLRSVQRKTPASNNGKLTSVQQAELDAAVQVLLRSTERGEAAGCLESLEVLHESVRNYTVDCWYFLARAILEPQESVKSYEEVLTDEYWQRYWAFLAYCNIGSPKGGAAVDRLRTVFSEHEDDIRLAETLYFLARGFDSFDRSMTERAADLATRIRLEYLSEPLRWICEVSVRLLQEGIRIDREYGLEETFVLLDIFRAGKYIEQLRLERDEREKTLREERAQQERRAQEEEERRERERQLAEKGRAEQQQFLAAERSKRMEREMARLDGTKTSAAKSNGTGTFVGYDTPLPTRNGKWKKRILIVIICLLVLLAVSFLIPTPEAWLE